MEGSTWISVCEPFEKEKLKKYVVYTIKGFLDGQTILTYRRFSDFEKVRKALLLGWPSCFIPSLPEKQLSNLSEQVIFKRMHHLDHFCQDLLRCDYLRHSEEFSLFLQDTSSSKLEKSLEQLAKQHKTHDLLLKFKERIPQLASQPLEPVMEPTILNFEKYLKRTSGMLDNFMHMAKNCLVSKEKADTEFNTFFTYLMPEYEQNYVKHCSEDEPTPFDSQRESLQTMLRDHKQQNIYKLFLNNLVVEMDDLNAIQESMGSKARLEQTRDKQRQKKKEYQLEVQSLLAGKKGLKNMLASKDDKQQSLQKKIEGLEAEIAETEELFRMVVVNISQHQIPGFKKQKQAAYQDLLQNMATLQKSQLQQMGRFWVGVSSHQE